MGSEPCAFPPSKTKTGWEMFQKLNTNGPTKFNEFLPSGKLSHNYGKIHHAINGKTHYFNGQLFKFANC
jgi:hypothetical protein